MFLEYVNFIFVRFEALTMVTLKILSSGMRCHVVC